MSSFSARLQLPGQTRLPLNVEVDIDDELMTLSTRGQIVASWPLEALEVSAVSDGFHIKIEGEELILSPDESAPMARALGVEEFEAPQPNQARNEATKARQLNGAAFAEILLDELRAKVDAVEDALSSQLIPPPEAFRRWLRLLKELNNRHGHGSISTQMYCELNARLLDLIPEPSRQLEVV